MKYVYFNDCSYEVCIHIGSATDRHSVSPGESIVIEIPSGTVPCIKTWDNGAILLSYTRMEGGDE